MEPNLIPNGLMVNTQTPLDRKLWVKTLDEIKDLGDNFYKAFYYYRGLTVLCLENLTEYIWDDVDLEINENKDKLLEDDYTYPLGTPSINNILYENRKYNFFLKKSDSDFKFTENFVVSLPDIAPGIPGRFGKYLSGETIPAMGKNIDEFIEDVVTSALEPTVGLTSSTVVQFNQTDINNVLNLSYVINSLGGVVESVSLEWRRNNTGLWEELTDDSDLDTFTHSLTDSNFNTHPFNYRYTVTDDKGGTKTVTLNITPTAYVAPTISSFSAGANQRDRGNISSSLSGTISRESPLVDIIEYQIQYKVNNGSWNDLGTSQSMDASGGGISGNHNDAPVNSDSLSYQVLVTDSYTTTTLAGPTVTFLYRNLLGYSSDTVLTLSQILDLTISTLSNSKSRTVTGVTAGAGEYTYYAYRAGAGDLTGIIQDGAAPVLGAFEKLTDVSGVNSYGATVSYRIYKSNATQAFTSNSLAFS